MIFRTVGKIFQKERFPVLQEGIPIGHEGLFWRAPSEEPLTNRTVKLSCVISITELSYHY